MAPARTGTGWCNRAAADALGPSLTLCPGRISNERRRCYSSPSAPSRHGRKMMCSGVYPPTGHRLKIAAPVRKGTGLDWASAFHGALGSTKLATRHPILDQGTHRPIHGLRRSTRESPISVTVVGIIELITFTHAESTTLMAARGMYKKVAWMLPFAIIHPSNTQFFDLFNLLQSLQQDLVSLLPSSFLRSKSSNLS